MRFHGYFYPRPPRGGRRSAPLFRPSSRNYFYPRPPRGGRRQARSGRQVAQDISIHALREEGDLGSPWVSVGFSEFLSTPSARRATDTFLIFCRQMQISIHALREEGDGQAASGADSGCDFYPRPPRGGRPARAEKADSREAISIHALREEGDYTVQIVHVGAVISIHALREEGDRQPEGWIYSDKDFYPRPPRGGRPLT